MKQITEIQAEHIFNLLVKHAGAFEGDRTSFLYAQIDREHPCREFRFCGKLGFGGKFWNNNEKLYINCYNEDENPKRNRIIKKVNRLLEAYAKEIPEND
ncbi:MAG: hypothetical protein V3U54_08825 [Thermodesulfobacteriota bacterium]